MGPGCPVYCLDPPGATVLEAATTPDTVAIFEADAVPDVVTNLEGGVQWP